MKAELKLAIIIKLHPQETVICSSKQLDAIGHGSSQLTEHLFHLLTTTLGTYYFQLPGKR
jgi:hypothetical protein